MYNLLRGEAFKLRRNKSFWWCAFATVTMILTIFVTLTMVGQIMQGQTENGTMGITVMGNGLDGSVPPLEAMGLLGIVKQLFSGEYMIVVIAVFLGIFVASEYGNGTMKNLIGKGYSREKVYLSRYLTAALAVSVLILIGVCTCLVCGMVCMGPEAFGGVFWRDLFRYIGLELVMNLAITAVFMLISEVIRNMAGCISAGLGIGIFSSLIVGGLDLVFVRFGIDFSLMEYSILDLSMGTLAEGLGAGDMGRIILVSVIWLAAALGMGIWHFRKNDV